MREFSVFLKDFFPDFKVQKISIDAGFSCPNRDGRIGRGGCTYCTNSSFNPDYCRSGLSITDQLEQGKAFFSRKYPAMKYLAYFQAYTNTYGGISVLKEKYEKALSVKDVVGLVIATRPDMVNDEILDYLKELSRKTFLIVEYGIESATDSILRAINRGHDFEASRKAVESTAGRGIITGGHMIIGLPGSNYDIIMREAREIGKLPLSTLKLHQLQILKGTLMEKHYKECPEDFNIYSVDEYIDIILDYVSFLPDNLVLERFVSQSPKELLVAPFWNLKNHEFADILQKKLRERGMSLYG